MSASGLVRAEPSELFVDESAESSHAQAEARPYDATVRIPSWLRASASTWVWVSVTIAVVGFVLIAVAWGQVSRESEVYRQLPYVVSAGIFGLAVLMVALAVLNVATRQRDTLERERQIDRLVDVMEELRTELRELSASQRQVRRR